MRAVLDPNVIISGLLSRSGIPARVLEGWTRGAFELVVSEHLLAELGRALEYPKLAERISSAERGRLLELLRGEAEVAPDPSEPPPRKSADPGDDYLIALSADQRVPLVSGDKHLTDLAEVLPILTPRRFLDLLSGSRGS
ncbi:MAG: putative toxin-antitoxin system toxin component, PIN family [Actinomycetota bacterium]|nr:putative toxin-antitoxin system toxin component, PIN family [Actinomycetota bacterium]